MDTVNQCQVCGNPGIITCQLDDEETHSTGLCLACLLKIANAYERRIDEEQSSDIDSKSLSNTNMDDLQNTTPDVQVHGNPGAWICVCKASSKSQGWMKSTKVFPINNSFVAGCLVQVSTELRGHVAESVCWAPGTKLSDFLPKPQE
jgi:hypothetical protein